MKDIIQMHASWIAISSIIGCYNRCKYCFLQAEDKNCAMPEILCSPEEAIEKLLKYKFYDNSIPICILPETDPFLNENNSEYVYNLLNEITNKNIKNDIVIVTKCLIPDLIIEKLKEMMNNGQNVVIYLSYSGLEMLEPNVKHEDIKQNFKNLANANIPIIHYFRPLLPQNSSKIKEIIDFVSQYTDVSTITGLKLISNFIDKIDFWPEILEVKDEALKAEGVYPEEAWEYLENYNGTHKFYRTNICALNYKLNRPSFYSNSEECKNFNLCSSEQRKLCQEGKRKIIKAKLINKCKEILVKLGYIIDNVEIELSDNSLEIKNLDLEISDLSYLSYVLQIKVFVSANKISDYTYNSTMNGAKPLILRRKQNE